MIRLWLVFFSKFYIYFVYFFVPLDPSLESRDKKFEKYLYRSECSLKLN